MQAVAAPFRQRGYARCIDPDGARRILRGRRPSAAPTSGWATGVSIADVNPVEKTMMSAPDETLWWLGASVRLPSTSFVSNTKIAMLSALDTLTLLYTSGIGRRTARRAQRLAKSLKGESAPLGELLQAIQADHPRMPLPSGEDLRQGAEEARVEIEHCEEAGIDILPAGSPGYPARLNGIEGWPPVLYRRGTSNGLLRSIAIVGTRDPSSWAPGRARAAAQCAVEAGLWVVSGLALGCDAAAHRSCLQAGGRTLALVAHGLDQVHPRDHEELAARLLAGGGALISEHPPGVPPNTHRFIRRNRLQSGVSAGIIVAHSPAQGGPMHTVRSAREQGRPIGVVVPTSAPLPEGNRMLLEHGATPLPDAPALQRFIDRLPLDLAGEHE
mgnify:CR=1 FL=1